MEPEARMMNDPATNRRVVERRLVEQAREARDRAYAPYSGFPVGAAILSDSGAVFTGCNVENAASPAGMCAERVALGAAVAHGERVFAAIAVIGSEDDAPCWPCGSCRQVLHEFAPELQVITPAGGGGLQRESLSLLLPRAFDLPRRPGPGNAEDGS